MHLSIICCALIIEAFAAADATDGFDPIMKPLKQEVITAGTTYTIEWQSTRDEKISLALLGGADPGSLNKLSTLVAGIDSKLGKFAWPVDASLGGLASYGLNLTLDSNPNTYQLSNQFFIKGSGSSSNGNSSATTSVTRSPSQTTNVQSITSVTGQSIITTTGSATPSTSATSTTHSSAVSTAGAHQATAGSIALIGGLAAAVFAL